MNILLPILLLTLQDAKAYVATSPAECVAGTHWTTSYLDQHGVSYRSSCRKNPHGYHFWHPRIVTGRPQNWPNHTEHTKRWTAEEKERVLNAIGRIPEALWPGHEIGIYRMDLSKDGSINTASNNDEAITLYDTAFKASDQMLTRYIAHEFAHRFWMKMDRRHISDYYWASGWVVTTYNGKEIVTSTRGKNYIYDDGVISPEEDFTNNIEAFLTDRNRLMELCPAIHDWIHEFFGDTFRLR